MAYLVDRWPDIVLGWPAVIASLTCAGIALRFQQPALMALGAVLAAPFSIYVSVYVGIAGPLSVCLYLAGAGALMLKRPRIALLLLMPFLAIAGWLAVVVLRQ